MSHYKARPCEVCGTSYQGTYSGQRTCGRQCGAALNGRRTIWPSERIYPTRCPVCQSWTTWQTPHVYCSQQCVAAVAKAASSALHKATYTSVALTNPEVQHTCPECGATFTTRRFSSRTTYCSETCSTRSVRRNRRHRLRANGKAERFTLREIAERDRWKCGLCGKAVKRDAEVPHPLAPTLDHIEPVACGGPHTRANVQLAHFMCNSVKSDHGQQQLKLIG